MGWEISLPFVALSGAAMTALAYRFWPRVAVRTFAEKHRGIGVREIAISISRDALAAAGTTRSGGGFAVSASGLNRFAGAAPGWLGPFNPGSPARAIYHSASVIL